MIRLARISEQIGPGSAASSIRTESRTKRRHVVASSVQAPLSFIPLDELSSVTHRNNAPLFAR